MISCTTPAGGRNEVHFARVLQEHGWHEFVAVLGQRGYQESLDEMSQADILVLFDSPGRTVGVPAKLFEYLGAGRPIFALAEPNGDTAAILRASGVLHRLAAPRDPSQIRQALGELTQSMSTSKIVGDASRLGPFTRENLTQKLASHLDALISVPSVTSLRIERTNAASPMPEQGRDHSAFDAQVRQNAL